VGQPLSDPRPTRRAGPVALAAGALFAVVDVLRLVVMAGHADRVVMLADPAVRIVDVLYFAAFVGLAVGLLALHGRQGARTGRLGAVALVAALAGTMTQAGNMWFDAFVAPGLAQVAPQAIPALVVTPMLQVGALLSYGLFALGWVLYGVASLRARVLPVAVALGFVVAGVLGHNSGAPPYGVPIGLAMAAAGAWLVRSDGVAAGRERDAARQG